MEDTIVFYTSPVIIDVMLNLAKSIAKLQPSIPLTVLSSAPDAAAATVSKVPSITYRRLPAVTPPSSITDPVELFFERNQLNNPDLTEILREISQKSTIKAFVIDYFCNPAFELSTSLNIPTYFLHSTAAAGLCNFLYFPTIDETIDGDIAGMNDYLEVPGCPLIYCTDFPKSMLFRQCNVYRHFLSTALNMRRSAGIVVNSFDALEYRAKEAISNNLCVPDAPVPPAYFVGPLVDEIGSGVGENSVGRHECLRWLDLQPRKSVIFLCFGRRGIFSAEQLREMAVGLEKSGHRFLWSVRSPPGKGDLVAAGEELDLESLLPKGFLERTKGRGFVVKAWAPQKEVLSHDSVGGFVTHCGMSSILEAVSFGVPMIGWPIYAEQRMNRVFAEEEMKLALPLEETADGFVTAAELEKRIRELMESTAGRAVRHRAAEMKVAAVAAARKNGSSVAALDRLIKAILGD